MNKDPEVHDIAPNDAPRCEPSPKKSNKNANLGQDKTIQTRTKIQNDLPPQCVHNSLVAPPLVIMIWVYPP